MNKKAIALPFLLTIILAIIIFLPACWGISKLFQMSKQAGESFDDFAKLVKEVSLREPTGEKAVSFSVLILDASTALIGFNSEADKVESCRKSLHDNTEICTNWPKPERIECQESSCLCLVEVAPLEVKPFPLEVKYKSSRCQKTEGIIFASPFYQLATQITGAPEVRGTFKEEYSFRGGFLLGRGLEGGALRTEKFNFENRRNLIYLMKKEGKVWVCWEETCLGLPEEKTETLP